MRSAMLLVAALAAAAQTRDLCTPPPAGTPPSLPARLMGGQGGVHFPITTRSPEAQKFFDQGVSQMHSFWATEAERSFLQAAALDPEAPMPHWGIAMVAAGDHRPRFQLNDGRGKPPARVLEAVRKAQSLAVTATPRERLYIHAVAARRFHGDDAYIAALRKLPAEIEARAYLALHLMQGFTLPDKEPRNGSMEAVSILRDLLEEAPGHPGVHHYVIHAFEGSSFARDAWESCRRYPQIAPNIPHALHMPGHIWAQTGQWEEAARAFEAAAENELGYIRADQLYGTGHHGHNVHFLAATYSFMGDYEKALASARSLLEFRENPREAAQLDNFRTAWRQGWFALLRTLVSFEKWDEILDGRTLPAYDKPREQAWRHWALGLALAARHDARAARDEAAAMEGYMKRVKNHETLKVARDELEGHIALAAGKPDKAIALLEAAARKERALRYNEPPAYPRPILEALGRVATAHGRPEVARAAYRQALEQYPESARARSGLR